MRSQLRRHWHRSVAVLHTVVYVNMLMGCICMTSPEILQGGSSLKAADLNLILVARSLSTCKDHSKPRPASSCRRADVGGNLVEEADQLVQVVITPSSPAHPQPPSTYAFRGNQGATLASNSTPRPIIPATQVLPPSPFLISAPDMCVHTSVAACGCSAHACQTPHDALDEGFAAVKSALCAKREAVSCSEQRLIAQTPS